MRRRGEFAAVKSRAIQGSEDDGLRIIAGSARGRKFDAPKGMDTRPTLERVKESLFGILQFELEGSSVLDLFSGSGNLGLEAASRGAAYVVCNDRSRECAEQIQKKRAASQAGRRCQDDLPGLRQLRRPAEVRKKDVRFCVSGRALYGRNPPRKPPSVSSQLAFSTKARALSLSTRQSFLRWSMLPSPKRWIRDGTAPALSRFTRVRKERVSRPPKNNRSVAKEFPYARLRLPRQF